MTEETKSRGDFLSWFRTSAPYIHSHRGKTFVLCFSGEAIESPGLSELAEDVALLHALGVRLLLVAGARAQIDRRLRAANRHSHFSEGIRVTEREDLPFIKEAVGANRIELEARLSMGLPNSAMAGARLKVSSGNFVTAQPRGVIGGVDFGFSGKVRRVDVQALRSLLDSGVIPIVTPLAYSLSGEVFNVSSHELACKTAVALSADKLICLTEAEGLQSPSGGLSTSEARKLMSRAEGRSDELSAVVDACELGVSRGHLIPRQLDGGLLLELFTRQGVGTMIAADHQEKVRKAKPDDVATMMTLLAPLERAGQLVPRPRALIEKELEYFAVIERESMVVGCAALFPFADGSAELACVAVHPDFRARGRGDALLAYLSDHARATKVDRIFALSTQTTQWFEERGFSRANTSALPASRQQDKGRGSIILIKKL